MSMKSYAWGWKIFRNGRRKRFKVFFPENGRSVLAKPMNFSNGERVIMPVRFTLTDSEQTAIDVLQ
jgi:hypothetical protein